MILSSSLIKVNKTPQSLPSNIQVMIRIRPLLPSENTQLCINTNISNNIITINPEREYSFDHILPETTTNEDIFTKHIKPNISLAFKGYNYSIIAYGQTSSGKTFTMGTSPSQPGIIQQTFNYIETHSSIFNTFNISLSFIEIYQDDINDLLCQYNSSSLSKQQNTFHSKLKIIENNNGSFLLKNITKITVHSKQDCLRILSHGILHRKISSTKMNISSSRSHAILIMNFKHMKENLSFKINFIDLAGSERISKTALPSNPTLFKESTSINKGLLCLSKVILSLSSNNNNSSNNNKHIPFRDSNLTKILKDSFIGKSLTTMICCISPSITNKDETISTLNYSSFAKEIKFTVHRNNQSDEKHMNIEIELTKRNKEYMKLKQENETLKNEVNDLKERIQIVKNEISKTEKTVHTVSNSFSLTNNNNVSLLNISNKINQMKLYQSNLNLKLNKNEEHTNTLLNNKHNKVLFYTKRINEQNKQIHTKQMLLNTSIEQVNKSQQQIEDIEFQIKNKNIELNSLKQIERIDCLYRNRMKLLKKKEMLIKDKELFVNNISHNENAIVEMKNAIESNLRRMDLMIKESGDVCAKGILVDKMSKHIGNLEKLKSKIDKLNLLYDNTMKEFNVKEMDVFKKIKEINNEIMNVRLELVKKYLNEDNDSDVESNGEEVVKEWDVKKEGIEELLKIIEEYDKQMEMLQRSKYKIQ